MADEQKRNSFKVFFIAMLVLFVIGILFLHSFLLVSSLETRSLMTNRIIDNKRSYTLLLSVINASHVLSSQNLNVMEKLSEYNIKLDGYNINFNVSTKPRWPIQLTGKVNPQIILHFLKKNNYQVKISYLMKNGKWLNYAETFHLTTYRLGTLLFLSEILVIIAVLFHGWSIYHLKEPLEKLKFSAERLGIDFKALPMKEMGSVLVRDAIKAMNIMQERIQELINTRTQLLAAISHDLRTPITRLQLRTQFIEDEELAQKFVADLEEMQDMIKGVLSFSRNDIFHEEKIRFDLVSLVLTICDEFFELGYNIEVTTKINVCDVHGRRIALKRCVSNVIHNATKFGKHLFVEIKQENQHIIISIQDDGPGIDEKELNLVYKPFYRVKSSSSKSHSGTGLGLTVAYEVVKDHQGEIKLENVTPHGLRVLIKLPINL